VSKSKRKKQTGLFSSENIVVMGVGAVIVALVLIVLSGGFAPPAAVVTNDDRALESCNGKPCPSKGSANAPVVVIEFSDYACHNCRDFNVEKASALDREYVETGKVRYVSHIFALWPESQPSAAAAFCAQEQSKYWEFHQQAFFNFQESSFPARDDFLKWAQLAGLDTPAFQTCVDSGRYSYDAQVSTLEGKRAGINTTPSFLINGKVLQGNAPLSDFRAAIETALAEAQP